MIGWWKLAELHHIHYTLGKMSATSLAKCMVYLPLVNQSQVT